MSHDPRDVTEEHAPTSDPEPSLAGASRTADLAIVGSYPPPFGGVTTHTMRLRTLLDQHGIRYTIYNAASPAEDPPHVRSVQAQRLRWLARFLATGREPVVYVMSRKLSLWAATAALARSRGKRVVIRLQCDQILHFERTGAPQLRLVKWIFRSVWGVVCVNPALADAARRLGARRVWCFPGFLPPAPWEHDPEHVAPSMLRFAEQRRPFIPVAGRVLFHGGVDLYGLDMLVELAARLKPDFPELGIGVCAWGEREGDREYLDELTRRARALGVEGNVLFCTERSLFVPLLKLAQASLRPTSSDGDANSLREALALGVPSVASDAAVRPAGCYLFRSRDLDDLEAKTRLALTQGPPRSADGAEQDLTYAAPYLDMLKELVRTAPRPRQRSRLSARLQALLRRR